MAREERPSSRARGGESIRVENLTTDPEGWDPDLRPVGQAPYDPSRQREWVRTLWTMGLATVSGLGITLTVIAILLGHTDVDTGVKVAGILSPVFALASAAAAFYFKAPA